MKTKPCPVAGCDGSEDAESFRLSCPPHWYASPIELRAAYWLAYREEGEKSERFLAAGEALIAHFTSLDATTTSS
jgi:hypothetical protein